MSSSISRNNNFINNNPNNHNNNMAFRGNQNRNRNFGGGNYGGGNMGGGGSGRMVNLNMSPWDTPNAGGNFGGGGGGGNMRQGGAGGQGMNAQALNLANNLLNNLFRNQNPPSLLDLPRGGAGMGGNRNQRSGQMINRGGGSNRLNNRRIQGGFQNRGNSGVKSNQKQGAGGIRKQNAFDRAKKLLAKNATNKKKDFTPAGEKKPESKESQYASVPNDMFYCHLCKKHMWDANSFENHIKGRTHLMMREGIEESYRLKANMIRQEAKIAEQLKSIELDRLKRMGKTKQRQLEFCTMCDLNFHGHISAHRKSDGHLQLKKFLHPKCVECIKEFATRIDYDSHLLSADHLIKAAEKNTKVGERRRNTLPIHTSEDELKDVRQPQKRKKKVVVSTTKKNEDGSTAEAGVDVKKEPGNEDGVAEGEDAEVDDAEKKDASGVGDESAVGNETKEGDEYENQDDEDAIPPVDPEDVIVDYVEGDEIPVEVENRLPVYSWARPLGKGLITKLECYECSLCGKFFDTEKTVEIHTRTGTHHRNFLKFLNEKSSDTKIAQKRAAAALEETERKKRKQDESSETAKNGTQVEEMSTDNTAEGGANAGDESHGELYDPSEATGDDDDVEMAENGDGANAEQDEEEGCEDELGGDQGEDDMDAQDVEEEANANDKPAAVEPTPVVATPTAAPVVTKVEPKQEPPQTPVKTPVKPTPAATPSPQVASTPSPMSNQNDQSSNMKKTGPRGGGAGKGTPRGRGRGRYNRY